MDKKKKIFVIVSVILILLVGTLNIILENNKVENPINNTGLSEEVIREISKPITNKEIITYIEDSSNEVTYSVNSVGEEKSLPVELKFYLDGTFNSLKVIDPIILRNRFTFLDDMCYNIQIASFMKSELESGKIELNSISTENGLGSLSVSGKLLSDILKDKGFISKEGTSKFNPLLGFCLK